MRQTSIRSKGAQLVRPLDFLVVADHAENPGPAPMIAESNPGLLADQWGRKLHDLVKEDEPIAACVEWGTALNAATDKIADDNLQRTIWNRIVDSADRFNEPGVFSAIHCFEWRTLN